MAKPWYADSNDKCCRIYQSSQSYLTKSGPSPVTRYRVLLLTVRIWVIWTVLFVDKYDISLCIVPLGGAA